MGVVDSVGWLLFVGGMIWVISLMYRKREPACKHAHLEPIVVFEEIVAYKCKCGVTAPASYGCSDCVWVLRGSTLKNSNPCVRHKELKI